MAEEQEIGKYYLLIDNDLPRFIDAQLLVTSCSLLTYLTV